ncbi:MAG: glucokinase [Chlamydiales bacterium]|nr:glucokinase [Chlamydiales bacterium]
MHLIGDIGGTKTHLALVEGENIVKDQKFPSSDYPNLALIIEEFLRGGNRQIAKACFGIAGPVRDGRCQATNLPWIVDSKELSDKLTIPHVYLINDLEANAWGLKALTADKLYVLNPGNPSTRGNQALISAGTGLGEAGIYFDGKNHAPFATEGGHADFAPRSDLEVELFVYLRKKFGHVSYERVLSGPGLANIYHFLVDTKKMENHLDQKIDEALLPRHISDKGLSGECLVCKRALEIFISLYGAETGNLALKTLSLGGIFVGGGIAPKILPLLKKGDFMNAYQDKGRFSELLMTIPVKIVLEEQTALLGAKYYLSVV